MKKKLLLFPTLLLMLAACGNTTPSNEPGTSQTGGDSQIVTPSEEVSIEKTVKLLAKYDLSDQVRTDFVQGQKNKFDAGEFGTFLKGQMAAGGVDKLASSVGETNVYTAAYSASATGPQFNGIKFGSSSAGGTVTLNFAANTEIVKVVVGAAGWDEKNTDTLTINAVTLTPNQEKATHTVEDLTFEFNATNVVKIETNKRIVFNYISIYALQ